MFINFLNIPHSTNLLDCKKKSIWLNWHTFFFLTSLLFKSISTFFSLTFHGFFFYVEKKWRRNTKSGVATQKPEHWSDSSGFGFVWGKFLNPSKINGMKSIAKGNWPTQNLVRVRGDEMDVQHPRRWQNSDVAFLIDSALLKEKSGVQAWWGRGVWWKNKVCIWLCRFAA